MTEKENKTDNPGDPGVEEKDEESFEVKVGKSINDLNDKIALLEKENESLKQSIVSLNDTNKDLTDKYRKLRFDEITSGGKGEVKDEGIKILSNEEILERFKF